MSTHFMQVEDERGRKLSLELLSRGLTVHRLLVERPGFAPRDLVCGPEKPTQYEQEGRRFKNQVIGRYTNRLAGGLSSIKTREGESNLELELERNDRGKNCLHSGSNGYDLRDFESISPNSVIARSFNEGRGTLEDGQQSSFFHLHSPAGDQGFPEAVDLLATITLTAPQNGLPVQALSPSHSLLGRLTFSLQARICERPNDSNRATAKGTPINLTWHIGYILNSFDKLHGDDGGIDQYRLGIDADHYAETDQDQLATGNINATQDVGFNLSNGDFLTGSCVEVIAKHIPKNGFDHCLIFKNPAKTDLPKVSLRSPTDDLVLNFRTNQTAVQCYSSNFFDGTGFRKDLHQNHLHQRGYDRQEALYLEFQQPNAICQNPLMQKQLELQHGKNTSSIIYPGEVYHNWFTIDIYVKDG